MTIPSPTPVGESIEPGAVLSQPIFNPRVLIVEDHEDTRFMLRTLLELRGASVFEAGDGESAIGRAESLHPDLILIDGRLPLIDGFEATSRLRRQLATSQVPIVFLSGDALPSSRARAFAVGCTDYLVKPIDFAVWDLVMKQYLAPAVRELANIAPGPSEDAGSDSTVARDPEKALADAVHLKPETQPHVARILIVDHDTVTAELIQFMMQNSTIDCEITSVLSPDDGLSLAADQRFDLYVLDYRLAAMTGVEVCHALRQTDSETPIMFFTGEANPEERQEAMRAGADAYLVKPNDIKMLNETVNRLLKRPKPLAAEKASTQTVSEEIVKC